MSNLILFLYAEQFDSIIKHAIIFYVILHAFLPRIAEFNLAQTVSLSWGFSCQPTGEFHGLEYANRLKASCNIFLLLSFFPNCCLRFTDCVYNCLPNSNIFSIACLLPPHNCFLLLLLHVTVSAMLLLCCWLWLALLSISANNNK